MADSDNDRDDVVRKIPAPKKDLEVNFISWKAGKPIYRIHSAAYTAVQFNPGEGRARFSPMKNGVATLYGGDSIGVAIMETLFHDLPVDSAGAPYDLAKLTGLVYSVIKPEKALNLVDLNPKTLRKMGIKRAQLLDSSADQYVFTREYSDAIHKACPTADGMQWSSKQHGDSALMLFGDRMNTAQLTVMIESESVQGSEAVIEAIEAEADQLGVVLIADSRVDTASNK